ncbi:GDNF family receptor alpha-1, partial [Lamprotornis superbus]
IFIICVHEDVAKQEPQPLLPQLSSGDQEREKERVQLPAQENRKEDKQLHAFETQEVFVLWLLVVVYTCYSHQEQAAVKDKLIYTPAAGSQLCTISSLRTLLALCPHRMPMLLSTCQTGKQRDWSQFLALKALYVTNLCIQDLVNSEITTKRDAFLTAVVLFFLVEPVLSKGNNCLDAAKACNLNDTCKRFRSAYITPCTSSTSNEICNKRKCHKALRLFFDKVPPKHSYGMLFCSCRDVACTERRRQTIVPVCSYEDREKPNCLNLQESCKKNYICRSRLADFFTNCQPESRSVSSCLKENYADCLLAYSGLIGTVMTPNYIDSSSLSVAPWCDCSNSGNDIDECEKFLNFFQDNICLKNAIQAFGNGTDVNVWQPILPVQTTTATTTTASRLKNTGSETTNNEIPSHNDSPACANLQAQKKRKSNESVDTELCLNEVLCLAERSGEGQHSRSLHQSHICREFPGSSHQLLSKHTAHPDGTCTLTLFVPNLISRLVAALQKDVLKKKKNPKKKKKICLLSSVVYLEFQVWELS